MNALAIPEIREIVAGCDKSVIERLMDGEKVHHADFKEIVNRLSPLGLSYENHVYGLYAPGTDGPPVATLCVKLMKLPVNERGHIRDSDLPGDILRIRHAPNQFILNPNTAIFYSVSNQAAALPGLPQGMSNAEYLIKQTAAALKEKYGIQKFSTLSPLRQVKPDGTAVGFGSWLDNVMQSDQAARYFSKAEQDTISIMANTKHLAPRLPLGKKFLHLIQSQTTPGALDMTDQQKIHGLLRALALHYIIHECKDPVEKFHLGNGALLGNIHVRGPKDTTENDWNHAYGVMVNYVYDLQKETLRTRSHAFRHGSHAPYPDKAPEQLNKQNRVAVNPLLQAEYRNRKSVLARDAIVADLYPQSQRDAEQNLRSTGLNRARAARAL